MMRVPKKWIVTSPGGSETEVTEPDPVVPVGLGTYLGLAGTLTAFAMALIAFIQGDRSEETIGPLVVGGLILYAVVKGRMDQAAAQARASSASVVQIAARGRKVG